MISNLRLNRSELTRRKIKKSRTRAVCLMVIAGLAIFVCLSAYFSAQASPSEELAEIHEQMEENDPVEAILHMQESGDDPDATELGEEMINWVSFYVEANILVPVHLHAAEGAYIAGSLKPGAVVYGFYYDEDWVCIADGTDIEYYVRKAYVTPFTKEKSEISFFSDHHEVASGRFSIYASIKNISGMTLEDISDLLKGYPYLQGIEEPVLLYERIYGVNAYFILGVASLESRFGASLLATRKNNLFGIGAYDESAYESALTFDSKAESIAYFCEMIARYGESGRTTPSAINEKYASDELWANKVVYLMNSYVARMNSR